MTIDNIKEEIQKAEDIVILTHENPDGDGTERRGKYFFKDSK